MPGHLVKGDVLRMPPKPGAMQAGISGRRHGREAGRILHGNAARRLAATGRKGYGEGEDTPDRADTPEASREARAGASRPAHLANQLAPPGATAGRPAHRMPATGPGRPGPMDNDRAAGNQQNERARMQGR
jgi:hypothetical protein